MQRLWRSFLRWFFELLYNEFAWGYDLVAGLVSLGHWKAWGRTTLRHLHGQRVLELGHGPGHLLVTLEAQGFCPIGIDSSPAMGRQAQTRLRRVSASVPLVRARAQALPFGSRDFDTIVATFPTDFIVDPDALLEVHRTLRPKGRLVVALGSRFDGRGLMATFLGWLYAATGQNQPSSSSFEPRLEEVGLPARTIRERVNQTTVWLLVAEKR